VGVFRNTIRFREPLEGKRPDWVQDPDDLPYLYLCAELGAEAIYTRDTDLEAMDAPVIGADVVVFLRDYSRAASIEVTIKAGGFIVSIAGAELIKQGWRLLLQMSNAISKLPRGIQLATAALVLAMIVHPKTRNALRAVASALPERAAAVMGTLRPLIGEALVNVHREKQKADLALANAKSALRSDGPQPLRVFALRVLLEERRPMRVEELTRGVLLNGYVTRAKNFHGYLARVLARHPEFTRRDDGSWMLSSVK
jgi:hypothetical protein